MFFYGHCRRNEPVMLEDRRPETRTMDNTTGDAGRDGFTVLSAADRETGIRPRIGGIPTYPGPRYED